MEFILHILGYFIIFFAIDYKRGPESKIEPFSKDYFIVLLMVFVAVIMLRFGYEN